MLLRNWFVPSTVNKRWSSSLKPTLKLRHLLGGILGQDMLMSQPLGNVNPKHSHNLLRKIRILRKAVIVVRIASGRPRENPRATVAITVDDDAEVEGKVHAPGRAGALGEAAMVATAEGTFRYSPRQAPLFPEFDRGR